MLGSGSLPLLRPRPGSVGNDGSEGASTSRPQTTSGASMTLREKRRAMMEQFTGGDASNGNSDVGGGGPTPLIDEQTLLRLQVFETVDSIGLPSIRIG